VAVFHRTLGFYISGNPVAYDYYPIEMTFPETGVIQSVSATCTTAGTSVQTSVDIRKNTISIFSTTLKFNAGQTAGSGQVLHLDRLNVSAGDKFRIYFNAVDSNIKDITININIDC
jgi:hypothetical protein